MGAREKLNQAYAFGSVLLACAVGVWTESWIAFLLVLVVLLASNLYFGEIRTMRRNKG